MSRAYANFRYRCNKRGIICFLTKREYNILHSINTCFYSKVKLYHKTDSFTPAAYEAWSIDRIDHMKPYQWNNVVVCSEHLNAMKNELFEVQHRALSAAFVQIFKALIVKGSPYDHLKEIVNTHEPTGRYSWQN